MASDGIEAPHLPSGMGENNGSPSTGTSTYTSDDPSYARDHMLTELHVLCEAASETDVNSWENVRLWFRNHAAEDARMAAERQGDYNTTPLHLACRNCPPVDIVNVLLTASPETVQLADSFGWLPLHYACANGASEDVLVLLAEQYPESKIAVDRRRRTPLHFALGHTERPAAVATVVLLSNTGASLCPDENGMLPLHYACAYGASEEALRVLTDNNIETITATDNRGRTPLHFALGNADRPASPGVVRILLTQNPVVVNSIDGESNLPLHLLSTRATNLHEDETVKRENAQLCLSLFLDANPRATPDLLTALQSLPEWLRDRAVVNPVVQKMLNFKISQLFPTVITILDFFFQIAVIICFYVAVEQSVNDRHNNVNTMENNRIKISLCLAALYLAALYFALREFVQMISLASLGLFDTWFVDPTNWLDVVNIVLVLYWSIQIHTDSVNDDFFQIGTSVSLLVFWLAILFFLRGIFIDFAVFVSGVIYVLKSLLTFIILLIITLVGFAQIFFTLFQRTKSCPPEEVSSSSSSSSSPSSSPSLSTSSGGHDDCNPDSPKPFCSYKHAFLRVYTMLLGEVDENDFESNQTAIVFYSIFIFVMVILLANVLIAIVTDSYGVIKNERAAVVFWSNRLDFVAEMDVISNNIWFQQQDGSDYDEIQGGFKRELWKKIMYLFEDDIDNHGVVSVEFIIYTVLRVFTLIFVIPVWFVIGIMTFGMLWPPQVREKLLTVRLTRRVKSDQEERVEQISSVRTSLKRVHGDITAEIDKGRQEIIDIKVRLDGTKSEIRDEMNNVKDVVTQLFEVVSQLG